MSSFTRLKPAVTYLMDTRPPYGCSRPFSCTWAVFVPLERARRGCGFRTSVIAGAESAITTCMWEPPDDRSLNVERLKSLLSELDEATTEAAQLHDSVNETVAHVMVDHAVDTAAGPRTLSDPEKADDTERE